MKQIEPLALYKSSFGDFINIEDYKVVSNSMGSLFQIVFTWSIKDNTGTSQRLIDDYFIKGFITDIGKLLKNDVITAIRLYDVDDCFHLKINKTSPEQYLLELRNIHEGETVSSIVPLDIKGVLMIQQVFSKILEDFT